MKILGFGSAVIFLWLAWAAPPPASLPEDTDCPLPESTITRLLGNQLREWLKDQAVINRLPKVEYNIISQLAEGNIQEAEKQVQQYYPKMGIDSYFIAVLWLIEMDNNRDLVAEILKFRPCINVNGHDSKLLMLSAKSYDNAAFYLDHLNMSHEQKLNLKSAKAHDALLVTVRTGSIPAIEWLDRHSVDLTANKHHAVCVAAGYGKIEVVQRLNELIQARGLPPLPRDSNALERACRSGDLPMVKHLVEELNVDVEANCGEPLAAAARHGHQHIVNYLIYEASPPADPCKHNQKARIAARQAEQKKVLNLLDEFINANCPSPSFWQLTWLSNWWRS